MGTVYLYGHTGAVNHGCEAIIRSTVAILKKAGVENIVLLSQKPHQDERFELNKIVDFLPCNKTPSLWFKALGTVRYKVFGDYYWWNTIKYSDFVKKVQKGDLILVVGGDTYCYEKPYQNFFVTRFAKKMHIPVVLWCCSINEKAFFDGDIKEDLERYTYILARETLTKELADIHLTTPKVLKVCDSAFQLAVKETPLPDGFLANNTVGINISPLVYNHKTRESIVSLVEHILASTDMNICFIPHVYDADRNSGDLEILLHLYDVFKSSGRVSVVNKNHTADELKFLISNCRFFVGARTHSTIAAYSTGVPTIALSYSIKSRGISVDLFGAEKDFVVTSKNLEESDALVCAFEALRAKEADIHGIYTRDMPTYREQISVALDAILKELNFE